MPYDILRRPPKQSFCRFAPDCALTIQIHCDDAFTAGANDVLGECLFLVQQASIPSCCAACDKKVKNENSTGKQNADKRNGYLLNLLVTGVQLGVQCVPFRYHHFGCSACQQCVVLVQQHADRVGVSYVVCVLCLVETLNESQLRL